jgi:hypothetical protein
MKTVRLSALLCFALLFSACSLKPTWDLAGKWQNDKSQETIEFLRNGTLTLKNQGTTLTTTYRMKDPKHMQIDVGSLGTLVMKVATSKDSLSLTDPSGKVTTLHKAK